MKPMNLDSSEFKTTMRGYDRAQVDGMLAKASDELATQLSRLEAAEALIAKMRAEIEGYKGQESAVKEALLIASRAAEETREKAQTEAEAIVQHAKQRADTIAREAKTALADVRFEIERLRIDKQKFINGFRGLLEGHLRELAEANRGLAVVDGSAQADQSEQTDAAQA